MKVMVIAVVVGALRTIPKGLMKGLEEHPDYSIIKISPNTMKCSGDLK